MATATGSGSPAITANTAAIAPSVEAMVATMPTCPDWRAVNVSSSPPTLPIPTSASQRIESGVIVTGRPNRRMPGITMAIPNSITHARTTGGRSSRVAREYASVEIPNANAAPSPPKTAIIGRLAAARAPAGRRGRGGEHARESGAAPHRPRG